MLVEIKLNTIVRFLNKELKINKIKDSSKNGLQVKAKPYVKKIGFAVDGCLSTFKKARRSNVDLLIVHHGIKWKPQKYKEITKKRENFLKKNKISLYAAHLPLDAHCEYGNNIGLARILKLKRPIKFARYHGFKIGYKGFFKKPKTLAQISKILNSSLSTKSRIFPCGKKIIKLVGIVSGGGEDAIEECVENKIDCLVLGEIPLNAYHRAGDFGLSVIAAGHYTTETIGVKLLQNLLKEKFNIKTVFIENKVEI